VYDAAARMRGLLTERERAIGLAIERDTIGDEIGDARGSLGGDEASNVLIDDARAGGDGVVRVR
jgi:hypothetical protein